MKKILFPVDSSMDCQKALDIAEKLAKKYDSTIVLFHVFDVHRVPNEMEYAVVIDKLYDSGASKAMLEKKVKYFEKKGVKATGKLVKGDPASDIVDEAENGDYDLCIICTHSMSTGRRFTLGSVTNKVVHHIKIPILVVR